MQKRVHSLIESITNVAIGYGVAVLSQIAIFPIFNIHIPLIEDGLLAARKEYELSGFPQ